MSLSPAFQEVLALPWPEIESRYRKGLISDGAMTLVRKHKPPEPKPLLVEKADRSARVGQNLTDAIDAYAKEHGVSKSVACDKVLLSPSVSEYVRLDKEVTAAERSARIEKGDDPRKYANKLDDLVAECMEDNPGMTRDAAYDRVLRSKKGKKCLEADKALRLGLPFDDEDDDRVIIDKLGGQKLPYQSASVGNPGGDKNITASDKKLLAMIADKQVHRTILDLMRRNNYTAPQAVKEAARLGIRLPKAVLDATADAPFPGENAGPLGKLQAMAEELRRENPQLSAAQAFNKVYSDPRNRGLIRAEYDQRMGKMYGG
jgi:hypothetical protein